MVTIEPRTVERTWTAEGLPAMTAKVTLPQPAVPADAFARRLRRYYQLQSRAFLRYCEKFLLPRAAGEIRAALAGSRPLPCFRAELTYQVTLQDARYLSLYTQSRETDPAGPALVVRRGDTWDLSTGYPAPLQTFLPAGRGWRKTALDQAAVELRRREKAGAGRLRADWPRALRRGFNPQNFYLTPEGVVLFFPMYAVAPAKAGIVTVMLPRRQGKDPSAGDPGGQGP